MGVHTAVRSELDFENKEVGGLAKSRWLCWAVGEKLELLVPCYQK